MAVKKLSRLETKDELRVLRSVEALRELKTGSPPVVIPDYDQGFCRYFGCGNTLFLFAEEFAEDAVMEIFLRQVNPKEMVEPLRAICGRATVVMRDNEAVGLSVWNI